MLEPQDEGLDDLFMGLLPDWDCVVDVCQRPILTGGRRGDTYGHRLG